MEKISLFLRQFGIVVLVGAIGIGVLIAGLWGEMGGERARVEIISGEQHTANSVQQLQIVVDVAGAVEKPGVYKLPSGSRIGDALVMAGGLSASADREWVAKSINLAEIVKDGGKIYIPEKGTTERETPSLRNGKGVTLGNKVNINMASTGELYALPGIGEARAKIIIENRPYGSISELLSKAKIPQGVYDKIKDLVGIY